MASTEFSLRDDQSFSQDDEPSQPKRVKKVFSDLNNEEEESMVKWFRGNQCLYNKKLNDYRDFQMKEQLWADRAEDMGKKVDSLKVWYKSIRTRFVKLKKKAAEDGTKEFTERDDWILTKFSFLDKHIGKVRPRRSLTLKRKLPAGFGSGGGAGSSSVPRPNPNFRSGLRVGKSRMSAAEGHEAVTLGTTPGSEQTSLQTVQGKMVVMVQPRVTERTAYADWLKTVIEGFEKSIWREFQYECSQLIYEYQRRNDLVTNEQNDQQRTVNNVSSDEDNGDLF